MKTREKDKKTKLPGVKPSPKGDRSGAPEGKRKRKGRNRKVPIYWTYSRCREEALKYSTLRDFYRNCESAYRASVKYGWIGKFDWLERGRREEWNEERVLEEARKYIMSTEFMANCETGYRYALRHHLLPKITWFIKVTPEFNMWMQGMLTSVRRLMNGMGIEAARQWLLAESGKSDVYTEDQRKLLLNWSGRVNENWFAWKRYKWYLYEDMDYRKRKRKGDYSPIVGNNIKP